MRSATAHEPIGANNELLQHLQVMQRYFQTGATKSYDLRKQKLLQLKKIILQNEEALYEALYKDLRKSREEVWVTEVGFLIAEINHAVKHLKSWMRPKRVSTNLLNLPSSSYIYKEPLGVVLIIGPWNYPLQLLFAPLIGAIAAGNAVVLKPSEHAPFTSAVMKKIIDSGFSNREIFYVEGEGAELIPAMMNQFRFDHVFFTGGTVVGKKIYEMAATKLVPVTLELGGKSPCIIEADANLEVAARRIAMTKFSNAGQMCIAPDYLLVHEAVKEKLIEAIKKCILQFYSDNPKESYNFGRIVNERQFDRIVSYLDEGRILHGGNSDRKDRYIEPTLMDEIEQNTTIMQDEIFGPVLPILTFTTRAEATAIILGNPNPLSLYIYTSSKEKEQDWIQSIPFGGGAVNNSAWHMTNPNLPFGGRGFSGMGACHGKYSFDCFTHLKAVMKTPTWFDPAIKYPPFKGKLGLFKKIIR